MHYNELCVCLSYALHTRTFIMNDLYMCITLGSHRILCFELHLQYFVNMITDFTHIYTYYYICIAHLYAFQECTRHYVCQSEY